MMVIGSNASTSSVKTDSSMGEQRSSRGTRHRTSMGQTAHEVAAQVMERTTVFDDNAEAAIPKFKSSEVVLGRVVGRGGFCVVQEVSAFRIPETKRSLGFKRRGGRRRRQLSGSNIMQQGAVPDSHMAASLPSPSIGGDNLSEVPSSTTQGLDGTMSREVLATKAYRRGRPRYVVKSLPQYDNNNRKSSAYIKGMVDLALEAKFLAALSHPNIIPLRGVSKVGPFDCDPNTNERYFLILDRLSQSLVQRIRDWANTDRASRGITGRLTGGRMRAHDLMVERLQVAHDIASALGYLHGRGLVYRDLKPDNVGFNVHGKVTLIDFGLCKQLREEDRVKGGDDYHMTGCTGALRYMAPEVGLSLPYGKKADVYSFGMLLWFIMALEPPFACYTPDMLPKRVFERGHRPFIMNEWSVELSKLVKSCWHAKPKKRPSFRRIKKKLTDQISHIAPAVALIMEQGQDASSSVSLSRSNKSGTPSSSVKGGQ